MQQSEAKATTRHQQILFYQFSRHFDLCTGRCKTNYYLTVGIPMCQQYYNNRSKVRQTHKHLLKVIGYMFRPLETFQLNQVIKTQKLTVKIHTCAAFQDFYSYVLIVIDATSLIRYEFDTGHPDVLVVLQEQIKGTSNTSTFIKSNWLHVSTHTGSSSGLLVESSH